jgi:hypothetical protein
MKKISGFWTLLLIVMGLLVMANKCEKDPEEEEIPTITHIDGNEYEIVEMGTQWWMAENLKVTRYNNGDLIGTSNPANLDLFHTVYNGGVPPKYQWAYNGVESIAIVYGRLYTWYAVTDPRGVCPTGWHVPSNDERLLLQVSPASLPVFAGLTGNSTAWESPPTGIPLPIFMTTMTASSGVSFSIIPDGDCLPAPTIRRKMRFLCGVLKTDFSLCGVALALAANPIFHRSSGQTRAFFIYPNNFSLYFIELLVRRRIL